MDKNVLKQVRRARRRRGARKRIQGFPDRPRLSVYRSLNHMYAQIIDDLAGRTLVSASTTEKGVGGDSGGGNVEAAREVGKALAERASEAGVTQVVLDRGGFRYHGRVKALADAAREGGLKF